MLPHLALLVATAFAGDLYEPPPLPSRPVVDVRADDCPTLALLAGEPVPAMMMRWDGRGYRATCNGRVWSTAASDAAVSLTGWADAASVVYDLGVTRLLLERDMALTRESWYRDHPVPAAPSWYERPGVALGIGFLAGAGLTVGIVYALAPGVE